MTRDRYKIYDQDKPHFVTCTIVGWLPLFGFRPLAEIIINSLRYLQESSNLSIYAWVIMENHLHMIVTAPELSKTLGRFKSFTAREIIDWLVENNHQSTLDDLVRLCQKQTDERKFQVWSEGYHPKQIQNESMMRQKVEYIHNNPVRRGYVDSAEVWRYSSAGDYKDRPGLLRVCKDW